MTFIYFTESDDEILRSWVFEDEFLVRFIRGRKYNLKSAVEKVCTKKYLKTQLQFF